MIHQTAHTMPTLNLWQRLKQRFQVWAAPIVLGDQPLLYTTKGNVPAAACQRVVQWEDSPDSIVYTEAYLLNGEVVKRSADVFMKRGVSMGAQAQQF